MYNNIISALPKIYASNYLDNRSDQASFSLNLRFERRAFDAFDPWEGIMKSVKILALATVLACGGGAARAATFSSVSDTAENSNADLIISFEETGVTTSPNNYSAAATLVTTCQCVTNSGNCPAAANKKPPATASSGVLTVNSTPALPDNRIRGCLVLYADFCPQTTAKGPTCPSGQTNKLLSVSWTGVTITNTTNSDSASAADQSKTFAVCKK
jgi:hypothetical protein